MSVQRLRTIVNLSVPTLFRQIAGGRVQCESEATLQLHLGRIIATAADLEITSERETFSVELEKPLRGAGGKRGRIDVWFRLTDDDGRQWRCAIELKFFKRKNHREPNNRYEVFKDIARLESCGDVADVGFMIVATDHLHYVSNEVYSLATSDFDFRNGATYQAGKTLTYNTGGDFGPPITLARDYQFQWADGTTSLHYLLLEVTPTP
ncbi:hypothetical protein F4U94_14025 [Sphingobium limneticum]|jgi:hypothetical protein|uniref:Uncharacterized protein n=1 Tax=Rhodopseudomonas palustris (strain ATCC BAA-98 / CGA009) TaxID=258594 RepID=Q6N7K2_RHOPA|nr:MULTISPECIES: hypothetical protein [Alphaproteobacteria]HQS96284.1 hypothetical protein [Novosphingobium sp.]KAA9014868.1 hypothetical protein F4U94_14025 [Sphingobium limneticum]MBY0301064.1 hypothetical protein [Sphingomonas ginsenosidimutans]OPF90472.1 hypothetical protein B1S06_24205 [Rhodopseudomonas palustris]OZA20837.1 MAG: hypothetical protein B7X90_04735 [Novosphingobium sp. 17-62-19]|tara:strand:+ start:51514 stop:52137 length:624 start_codon:yes stop_codon:yes gene_type:complete